MTALPRRLGARAAAGLVLVGLNLAALAYSGWQFRREQALYVILQEPTPDAYARAIPMAPALRDRLLMNLGNRYLEQGLKDGDPGALRAAIAFYKESLRLNPRLLPAKKNLEIAGRLLAREVETRRSRRPMELEALQSGQTPLSASDI